MTTLMAVAGVVLGVAAVIAVIAVFVEHTKLGQRVDRFVTRLLEAGL